MINIFISHREPTLCVSLRLERVYLSKDEIIQEDDVELSSQREERQCAVSHLSSLAFEDDTLNKTNEHEQ